MECNTNDDEDAPRPMIDDVQLLGVILLLLVLSLNWVYGNGCGV